MWLWRGKTNLKPSIFSSTMEASVFNVPSGSPPAGLLLLEFFWLLIRPLARAWASFKSFSIIFQSQLVYNEFCFRRKTCGDGDACFLPVRNWQTDWRIPHRHAARVRRRALTPSIQYNFEWIYLLFFSKCVRNFRKDLAYEEKRVARLLERRQIPFSKCWLARWDGFEPTFLVSCNKFFYQTFSFFNLLGITND